MKTPRHILLSRHQDTGPKLDAISRDVLRKHVKRAAERHTVAGVLMQWLWPSPVAWASVAAVWVLIAGLHLASSDLPPEHRLMAKRSPEMLEALREQQRLFVELVSPPDDAEPQPLAPKRRSERDEPIAMA